MPFLTLHTKFKVYITMNYNSIYIVVIQSTSYVKIGGGSQQLYYHDCLGSTSQVTSQRRHR